MASHGFPKTSRLLNAGDYQRVFEQSRLKVSTPEVLFLARENGLSHARLGLVMARKNVRLAVQRNRIKRIIRDSFRHHHHQVAGLDIVVLARRGLDKLDNPTLHKTFEQLWYQLGRRAQKNQQRDNARS